MTQHPPIDPTLRDEALDLLIRIQNDPTSSASVETARRWRARSAAHVAAWDAVAELHSLAGDALSPTLSAGRGPSRRAMLAGGAGALAAGVAGALVLPGAVMRFGADAATATAEIRSLPLPGGGAVTLGPDSAVRFAFDQASRRVDLLAGMAFFEPAPVAGQDFEATAGGVAASTSAGAFDLSEDAGVVSLTVARGSLSVRLSSTEALPTLGEGEWVSIAAAGVVERGRREASAAAAWRAGSIVAERETIASVGARIARWMPGRLLVEPAIGQLRVSGVYNLKEPLSALSAVARPHGGHVRQATPWLTVISRI